MFIAFSVFRQIAGFRSLTEIGGLFTTCYATESLADLYIARLVAEEFFVRNKVELKQSSEDDFY